MVLDGRHPYWGPGDGAEDEERGDTRRDAISLSDRCQKFFDTIIRAYPKRLKAVPTSWSKEADETSLLFKVACALEVILDELAGEFATLGDGGVIGALRTQRDTAKAEREAQGAPPGKGQDAGSLAEPILANRENKRPAEIEADTPDPKGDRQQTREAEAARFGAKADRQRRRGPKPTTVPQLAEWLFVHHVSGERNPFDQRCEQARDDPSLSGITKRKMERAYRSVYETAPHAPPKTGWQLQPAYQRRWEKEQRK
jgi:hypothetical protein